MLLAAAGQWCRSVAAKTQWHPLFSGCAASTGCVRHVGHAPRMTSQSFTAHQCFTNPKVSVAGCRPPQRCLMRRTERVVNSARTAIAPDCHCSYLGPSTAYAGLRDARMHHGSCPVQSPAVDTKQKLIYRAVKQESSIFSDNDPSLAYQYRL